MSDTLMALIWVLMLQEEGFTKDDISFISKYIFPDMIRDVNEGKCTVCEACSNLQNWALATM